MSKQRTSASRLAYPSAATEAVIGESGITLSPPAAMLLGDPPQGLTKFDLGRSITNQFGGGLGLGFDVAGLCNPVFAIAAQIPTLNTFIGNDVEGKTNPNGGAVARHEALVGLVAHRCGADGEPLGGRGDAGVCSLVGARS